MGEKNEKSDVPVSSGKTPESPELTLEDLDNVAGGASPQGNFVPLGGDVVQSTNIPDDGLNSRLKSSMEALGYSEGDLPENDTGQIK